MGSSGTGNFSDYSGRKSSEKEKNGGASDKEICLRALSSMLEDVARCDYYINHRDVPPLGTDVEVVFDRRLVVKTLAGESIGYLPTKFNYIVACLEDKFRYTGQVSASSVVPIPSVTVDIFPSI